MSITASTVDERVVIVGAGLAGVQVACALRTEGFAGRIVLIGDEPHAPYHRPPLSKKALDEGARPETIRPSEFLATQDVVLELGACVELIDVEARTVELSDGRRVAWDHLVLATGASARTIPHAPAVGGIHRLRSFEDARRLWSEVAGCSTVAVIGAGFVGLEFAAAANAAGIAVTVVEAGERVMQRAVSAPVSAFVTATHAAAGVGLRLGTGVTAFETDGDAIAGLILSDGTTLEADLVLIAVGARPNTDLATAAGLAVNDGVLVDECMRASAPGVLAVGDCARWRVDTVTRRLESVQNATDQASVAARTITGTSAGYSAVPWFWSDQGGLRLQMAGIAEPGDEAIVIDDGVALTVIHHAGGALHCVETVNQPGEHLAARRLIGTQIDVESVRSGTTLKQLMKAAAAR